MVGFCASNYNLPGASRLGKISTQFFRSSARESFNAIDSVFDETRGCFSSDSRNSPKLLFGLTLCYIRFSDLRPKNFQNASISQNLYASSPNRSSFFIV